MRKAGWMAFASVLAAGTALAAEYRGDVFAPDYSELQVDFTNSKYDDQSWLRPYGFEQARYHDTLIILHEPGCVWIQTGSPTVGADTMLYLSYSNDENADDWEWLDDDSGHDYLSEAFLRYESGSGQRRVRIRTTGYSSVIDGQQVNVHIHHQPLSQCPESGFNVADI